MSDLIDRLRASRSVWSNEGGSAHWCPSDIENEAATALAEAADAWEAFKAANTTDAHFAAVARLDAALPSPHATKGGE